MINNNPIMAGIAVNPWEPSDSDVNWLQKTLSCVKEGGVWMTCLLEGDVAYEVSHEKKRLLLVGNENPTLHERTTWVVELMGWEMKIPCKSCEDSGYEKGKVECHYCDGFGKTEEGRSAGSQFQGWSTCNFCEGYKDEDCIDCEGEGEQNE